MIAVPILPSSATCTRLLDEKWCQAYQAVVRFGIYYTSTVFRYPHMLEGASPPLAHSHLTCKTTAKCLYHHTCVGPLPHLVRLFTNGTVTDSSQTVGDPVATVFIAVSEFVRNSRK